MNFVKAMDNLPWIVKLIFALPGLNIIWGIYRLIKGIVKKNGVLTIAGIVWIFAGWVILWVIDLITVIANGRPTVFAD